MGRHDRRRHPAAFAVEALEGRRLLAADAFLVLNPDAPAAAREVIPLQSFSWGTAEPAGAAAGKPSTSLDVTFDDPAAETAFARLGATGRPAGVELVLTGAGAGGATTLTYDFTDAFAEAVRWSGQGSGSADFAAVAVTELPTVHVTDAPTTPAGADQPPTGATWDVNSPGAS